MTQRYPKAKAIRLDSYAVMGAWACLALTGVAWLAATTLNLPVGRLAAGSFASFLALALAHLVLAFRHKCPECLKRPTVQGLSPVHPGSAGQAVFEGWAGVVVSVVRRKRFCCIHCGTPFSV